MKKILLIAICIISTAFSIEKECSFIQEWIELEQSPSLEEYSNFLLENPDAENIEIWEKIYGNERNLEPTEVRSFYNKVLHEVGSALIAELELTEQEVAFALYTLRTNIRKYIRTRGPEKEELENKERDLEKYGQEDGPTWEQLLEYYGQEKDAYKKIIESAQRSNKEYNEKYSAKKNP